LRPLFCAAPSRLITSLVSGIIAKRHEQGLPLNPDWIAFEAVKEMDSPPNNLGHQNPIA
jgi:hypothetical protein